MSNIEFLATVEALNCLAQSRKRAKDLEKDQDTKVFAVGVMFLAENANYVYTWNIVNDKAVLEKFISNLQYEGKPVHADISNLANDIMKYLKGDNK
jgi:hypothetical protein